MDLWYRLSVMMVLLLALGADAYAQSSTTMGMTCQQIGDLAETVAIQKHMKDPVTRKEALEGLHDSLSGGDFRGTEAMLRKVIMEIYDRPDLANLDPQLVKTVFKQDCEARGR